MIAAWMLYSTAVGALMATAGCAAHYVCRMLRFPVRWAWASAMVVTLALSLAALVELTAARSPALPDPLANASIVEQVTAGESTPVSTIAELLRRAGSVIGLGADRLYSAAASSAPGGRGLGGAWLLASTALFVLLCGTLLRLGRARRGWTAHRIGDVPVLVSRDAGPALIGLLRPSIVVPAWLLAEPAERQQLVVQHEVEHRRAGDHMLLAAACAGVCLLPWNVALWWMLLRMRLAVELDCDARVLRRGVKARSYGSLLLEIAGRTRARPFGAPALADSGTHLERRLIAMTDSTHSPRRMRAAGAIMSALLLVAAACTADLPTAAAIDDMDVEQATARAEYAGVLAPTTTGESPLFVVDGVIVAEETAHDVAPADIGSVEVVKAPAALKRYGERAAHGAVLIRTRSAQAVEGASTDDVNPPLGEPLQKDASILVRRSEAAVTPELTEKDGDGSSIAFKASAVASAPGAEAKVRGELRRRPLQASPLIIIDGVVTDESFSLSSLAPESIESVEIVKGAAARMLYDDRRAVNGVIRITTKPAGK